MENSELSKIAKINVEMDILTGEYLSSLDKSQTFHEPLAFPSQQVGLMIDEQRIATNIEDELIAEYFKESIIKHYKNVVKVPEKAFENIQWHTLKLALRDSKNKNSVLKALHSQWQTMHVCHKWNLSKTAECPLCEQEDENWNHVLQCPNIHVDRVRKE